MANIRSVEKQGRALACLTFCCALLCGCATVVRPSPTREIIVATRNVAAIDAAIREVGTIVDRSFDGRHLLIRLGGNKRLMDALVRLTQEPDVVYVTPNFATINAATPNDPNFQQQWALKKTQTDLAWDI